MKLALIGAATLSFAVALPASAQRVPDTPAVGTRYSSAATGFVRPNSMVVGSTSVAAIPDRRPHGKMGRGYYDSRQAYRTYDPRYETYAQLYRRN